MPVDFGQKRVQLGERLVVVHLLVAVLSYSRRLFAKAFPASERPMQAPSMARLVTATASSGCALPISAAAERNAL
jgi:hypothetical protein